MSNIPPELFFDILLRLSPKDLIRCICVCKAWNSFIHNQSFIKAHHEANSSRTIVLTHCLWWKTCCTDFMSLALCDENTFGTAVEIEQPRKHPGNYTDILGCCNGLVGIRDANDRTDFAVWNPSIQKFKKIPFTNLEAQPSSDVPTAHHYGFGYDSVNDDYKLVKITEFVSESSEVKVYSLNSNTCRRIQNIPCYSFEFDSDGSMVYSNGGLSWLMSDKLDKRKSVVLTLYLSTEKYQEFSSPVNNRDEKYGLTLEVLEENLCLCVTRDYTEHEIWIMKERGVAESWTRICSVVALCCRPMAFSKNGDMILFQHIRNGSTRLSWYDLEKKNVKEVEIRGLPKQFEAITICSGSLRLLDGYPVTDAIQN